MVAMVGQAPMAARAAMPANAASWIAVSGSAAATGTTDRNARPAPARPAGRTDRCDTREHARRVPRLRADRGIDRSRGPPGSGDRDVDHGRVVAERRGS